MAQASAASLQEMRQQIDSILSSAPPATAAMAAAAPTSVQGDFCALWPNAKPILQAIGAVIVFIPGIGAGAGPVLNALVTVGDQIFSATCQRSP